MRKILVATLMLISFTACGEANVDVADWQEDLDYYAQQMAIRHIDPFHAISRNNFEAEITRIKNSVSSKTKNEVIIEFMRLTRKIDDGHTSIPLWGSDIDSFPLELKFFGE